MQHSYLNSFKSGLRPDPYINLIEWSNTYRRLPKESSVEPGQYRTSRTPYVEEIMQELSVQSDTQTVVVLKGTQLGMTEVGNCFLFMVAHIYPGPCMMVFPTDALAKKHSKKKIAPSVKAMPCLQNIIKEAKSRDSGNTLLLKEFAGGSWTFTGSNSPASARSDSIRYLILDDLDGFTQEAGDEGAPHDLFKKRTDAFGSKRKIYINSTPTVRGISHIEREWEDSSQGEFSVPCPHCNSYQSLVFGGKDAEHGIKFSRDANFQVIDVWYQCISCKRRIDEWQKTEMMLKGRYEHKYPEREKRGFRVNSLYSPVGWLSWKQIVEEFLKAAAMLKKGNANPLKVWTNTRMAQTFEEDGEQPEWTRLQARAEPYQIMTVPQGGLLLVAGVDVQDNRLEVLIQAFGRNEESWVIYQCTIYGDPDLQDVWKQLDELLNMPYKHQSGGELYIMSAGIDTGGHKTQSVYAYCRSRSPRVFAVKGSSTMGKPILNRPTPQDIDFKGVKIPNGVELWSIGTDTAKGTIYNRLKLTEHGGGFYHFPIGLDEEFYKQLTAEKIVKRYVKGFPTYEWVKMRDRNDVLDTAVYCLAAAIKAGVNRINWDKISEGLENYKSYGGVVNPPVKAHHVKRKERPQQAGGYQRPSWMS